MTVSEQVGLPAAAENVVFAEVGEASVTEAPPICVHWYVIGSLSGS